MSRRLVPALGLLNLALASGAFGATPSATVPLPSPATPLTRSPPLQTDAALFELRLTGRVVSRQQVDVGIGPSGTPTSVTATQRLTLDGAGDYSFATPAPVVDVVAAAGSDSEPGLRRNAILWQGFSPGRRLLGVEATLRVRDSAPSLPLRVSVDARVDGTPLRAGARRTGALRLVLTIRNATTTTYATFEGTGVVGELARVLDGLRGTIERGDPYQSSLVRVAGSGGPLPRRQAHVEAPLDIRGLIRFPTGAVTDTKVDNGRRVREGISFASRLGDGTPLRLTVLVRGRGRALGPPVVEIEVRPVLQIAALRPPRGESWRQAVARGLVRLDGRAMMRKAIDSMLRVALVRQYSAFLSNPDGFVRARSDTTVYVYRTAPPPPSIAPRPAGDPDGNGVLLPVLLAVGGVVGAAALLVVWAHS